MHSKVFGCGSRLAVAALSLAVVAGAPAAQGAAGKHQRHHRARHRQTARHHTSRAVPQARLAPRAASNMAACVPGGDPANPEKTIAALRFNSDTLAQFDAIFRCLGQGETPMPGWNVAAKGYVRLAPDAGPGDQVLMTALMNVWQGKHWYTHADGGYIYNRMFDDRQTWYHRVTYTHTTLVDNRPAIFVDASPVPGIDNIRMVQPGVYLGITMTDGTHPLWGPNSTWTVPRGLAHGYFILDFKNTEVTKSECPLCTPNDQNADPVPLPAIPGS